MPSYSKREWILGVGWFLIAQDLGSWFLWIAVTAYNLSRGGDRLETAALGFTALAAPHTVIVPTLLAIMRDVRMHCASDEACALETPQWQWYFFTPLVLPLDVLSLVYNRLKFPDDKAVQAAGWWALSSTLAVFFWSVVSGLRVRDSRDKQASRKKTDGNAEPEKTDQFMGSVIRL